MDQPTNAIGRQTYCQERYQNAVSRKIRGTRKEWEGERKPNLSLIASPDSEEPGLVYHIVKSLTNPPTPGQPIAMINNWNLYLSM
jgi:hypothetical protein